MVTSSGSLLPHGADSASSDSPLSLCCVNLVWPLSLSWCRIGLVYPLSLMVPSWAFLAPLAASISSGPPLSDGGPRLAPLSHNAALISSSPCLSHIAELGSSTPSLSDGAASTSSGLPLSQCCVHLVWPTLSDGGSCNPPLSHSLQ